MKGQYLVVDKSIDTSGPDDHEDAESQDSPIKNESQLTSLAYLFPCLTSLFKSFRFA